MLAKTNLKNIFTALGITDEVDLAPEALRQKVSEAMQRQFVNDRKFNDRGMRVGFNTLNNMLAYDRNAIKEVLRITSNQWFTSQDPATKDALQRRYLTGLEATMNAMETEPIASIDVVLGSVVAGLPEQQGPLDKIVHVAEKNAEILSQAVHAGGYTQQDEWRDTAERLSPYIARAVGIVAPTTDEAKKIVVERFQKKDKSVLDAVEKFRAAELGITVPQLHTQLEQNERADKRTLSQLALDLESTPKVAQQRRDKYRASQRQIMRNIQNILGLNEQVAHDFLYSEIDLDNPIFSNTYILNNCADAVAKRRLFERENTSDDEPIRVIDLMMYYGESVTRAQVHAFYQNRAEEQNQQKGEKALAPDSPQKLGNVLGTEGRKFVKEATGKGVANNLGPKPAPKPGKPLPEHYWRGYKMLADKIKETVTYAFAMVQTGNFVERLTGKWKTKNVTKRQIGQAWEVPQDRMPTIYHGTKASEFYEKTQARMLDDQITFAKLNVDLQSSLLGTEFTLEDVERHANVDQKIVSGATNVQRIPLASPQQEAEMQGYVDKYMEIQYYAHRQIMGKMVLAKLQQRSGGDVDLLNNSQFLENLDKEVVDLGGRPLSNLTLRNTVSQQVANNPNVTANDYLENSLNTFVEYNQPLPGADAVGASATLRQQNALRQDFSYQTLADVFGIRAKYDAGEITKNDLQEMMASGNPPFNPTKAQDLIDRLHNKTITAHDAKDKLHQSAQTFLTQYKYASEYTNYNLLQGAKQERERL